MANLTEGKLDEVFNSLEVRGDNRKKAMRALKDWGANGIETNEENIKLYLSLSALVGKVTPGLMQNWQKIRAKV